MTITIGGVVYLVVIAAIIGGIYLFNKWRRGETIAIKKPGMPGKKREDDTVLCFTVYPDKFKVETMLKKSVVKGARIYRLGGKLVIYQGWKDGQFFPLHLPDNVAYLPSKLARMLNADGAAGLWNLKFGLLEELKSFAPVAAIAIGGFLLIITMGA